MKSGTVFTLAPLAIFLFALAPGVTHAHGEGMTFTSTISEGYVVDVDYSDLQIEAGRIGTAADELLPKLKAYKAIIADTIGLRGQSRLPDHVAVEVASCSATPRDIFLNF